MRLFIAILFEEGVKDSLFESVRRLKSYSSGGGFTERDTLHLTVNFIGETKRLEEVQAAMNRAVQKVKAERFLISISGLGMFKRKEGDIYWVGVAKETTLWRLQKELVTELKEAGFFDIDDHEYKPHLTLGRRIKLKDNFDAAEFEAGILPMQNEVAKISLIKSERLQGKLVYTEIYHVNMENNRDNNR
ncbi:MAG: RNA 2',3'-cyclic phosphodiesterase [Mobilitalea sp.]